MTPENESKAKQVLAQKLSEIRQGLGLSRAELAQKTGTSATTIQNYESNDGTWPSVVWLYKLAVIAKLDVWDITRYSEQTYKGLI